MINDECIFCKIVSGEIPSVTVYEDDEFKAFLDAFPANEGHVLIIPKDHVPNFFELDEGKASRLFILANKIAKTLKEELDFDGMNVLQNNGEVAGQTVFHYHMHLIPRYKDDGVTIHWRTKKILQENLLSLGERVKRTIIENDRK